MSRTFKPYGHLYALHHKIQGVTKVGISKKPNKRIMGLITTCGFDRKDVEVFISERSIGYVSVEKDVHSILKGKRTKGEWFLCDMNEARSAIIACVKVADAEYCASYDKEMEERGNAVCESMKKFMGFEAFEMKAFQGKNNSVLAASCYFNEYKTLLESNGFEDKKAIGIAAIFASEYSGFNIVKELNVETYLPTQVEMVEATDIIQKNALDELRQAFGNSTGIENGEAMPKLN